MSVPPHPETKGDTSSGSDLPFGGQSPHTVRDTKRPQDTQW